MNYFAHGRWFVDDAYFLAGTAIPDWLNVVDRKVRIRSKHATPFSSDDDPHLAAVARGVCQHCADDAWFHETRAFAELNLEFSVKLRDLLASDEGFRPHFVGHILVEMLLDAVLIEANTDQLHGYYAALDSLDAQVVHAAVARIAGREAQQLAEFIPLFCRERFLWDYREDGKLLFRLNQVLRRVKLPPLPAATVDFLAFARERVAERQAELLTDSRSKNHSNPIIH